MYSSKRDELRNVFFAAWQKHLQQLPVEPLEAQIIDIVIAHPEYHKLLENPDDFQQKDFAETNPFLHLSLHLALREQIATDRPNGIQQIYQNLNIKIQDTLTVEHRMMECLEKILWEAQQTGIAPDEKNYLENLRNI